MQDFLVGLWKVIRSENDKQAAGRRIVRHCKLRLPGELCILQVLIYCRAIYQINLSGFT